MPHSLVDIQSTVASKENKTMKQSLKKNIPQRFQSLFSNLSSIIFSNCYAIRLNR